MKIKEIKEWYIRNEQLYFTSIELTQTCNFKCNHCYCVNKQSNNLSLDNWMEIIDKLHRTGCLFLNFTGGEILTYKYFKEIYTYAKNKGFIVDLLTNSSLIDEELIKLFKILPPNNIAITIYGTNEYYYDKFTGNGENYNKTIKSLELLKKNNIQFVLRTVATKTLRDPLLKGDFESIAKKFNTTFKYDPIIFPKISGDNTPLNECMDINQIIELENKDPLRKSAWNTAIKNKEFCWSCYAGVNSMAIDFQGNAFICGLYRNNPISILKNDINKVLQHLKKIHNTHSLIVKNNECSNCNMRNICKWCPAYSYIYNNNDYKKIEFFCKLAKARKKAFEK